MSETMKVPSFRWASGWKLSLQAFVALSIAVLIVAFLSGEVVRRAETTKLTEDLREQSVRTTALLAAVSIDAVISEDIPLLETIIEQSFKYSPKFHALLFVNEKGEVLAVWQRDGEFDESSIVPLSNNLVFEGETFGQLNIDWNVEGERKVIENSVFQARLYTTGTLTLLSVMVVILFNWLALRPLTLIHSNLKNFSKGHPQTPLLLPFYLATEFTTLGNSVNLLASTLEERRCAEQALRESEALLRQAVRMGRMGHWEWCRRCRFPRPSQRTRCQRTDRNCNRSRSG